MMTVIRQGGNEIVFALEVEVERSLDTCNAARLNLESYGDGRRGFVGQFP
jgi:hypothetical protein